MRPIHESDADWLEKVDSLRAKMQADHDAAEAALPEDERLAVPRSITFREAARKLEQLIDFWETDQKIQRIEAHAR